MSISFDLIPFDLILSILFLSPLQIKLRKQLRELVHAGPGFSLNPESVNKSKDVYNYLKSEELRNTRIILWHDLINNTITPHKSNNYQPQSVNQLVASLRSLPKLCGIVYCQRTGSPNIFENLRTLDCPIIQVTTDILSKSEQRSEVLVEKYKALHHRRTTRQRIKAQVAWSTQSKRQLDCGRTASVYSIQNPGQEICWELSSSVNFKCSCICGKTWPQ